MSQKIPTPQQLSEYNIHVFNEFYQIKNEQGLPLEFKSHAFMWDIYSDMSPKQAIMKPPQIGATVMMIIKSLWVAKNLKKDIIYTLPTQSDVNDMAGGKVNRLIAQNPVFREWVKEHDSVEQKTVGDNIIYYRGTWTNKQAMMVSSQLNIHDEVDASKEDVIVQYETRQQANKDGWRWYFSHPSLVGHGVHKYYLLSDQKHRFHTCPYCKYQQYLSWDTSNVNNMSIDIEKEIFVCKKCRKELPDSSREKGVWIKKYNDNREYSGWWINQLMCSWITAKKIIADYREKTPEYFYNQVLGLPYIGSGNQVTEDIIYKNLTDTLNDQRGRIVIGVDSGLPLWITIWNKQGMFYYGSCKDWGDIEKMLMRWPQSIVVADQGGDLIGVRKLQEKFPNRVFLCFYRHDRKTQDIITWGEGDKSGEVVVDRNKAIQMVIDEFTDKRIPLYGNKTDWHDYVTHWMNIYRTTEEDSLGIPRYVWERSGPDHLVHATVYGRVGMDRFLNGETTFNDPSPNSFAVKGYEDTPNHKMPFKI